MMSIKEDSKLPILHIQIKKNQSVNAVLIGDIIKQMGIIEYDIQKLRDFEDFKPVDYQNMWIVLKELLYRVEGIKVNKNQQKEVNNG